MQSMYAKLFSRIAQSSLMEEDVEVRYCFMMLLAIADQNGDVIGTDVAIARTVNLPLEIFQRCIKALMEPDPASNSPAHEGRRLVNSDSGRGYLIVNYTTYRAIKTVEEKRAYMREYMRRRRNPSKSSSVTPVNIGKNPLTDVTHAEAEAEAEALHEREHRRFAERPSLEEVKMYASTIGLGAWKAEDWFQEMEGCGWLDFNSRPISKWQAVIARVKTKWEADGRPNTPPAARQTAQNSGGVKDTFWRDTERLKQVEGEIKSIEGRASHTAMDVIIQPQDKDKYGKLKTERKDLKKKMNL